MIFREQDIFKRRTLLLAHPVDIHKLCCPNFFEKCRYLDGLIFQKFERICRRRRTSNSDILRSLEWSNSRFIKKKLHFLSSNAINQKKHFVTIYTRHIKNSTPILVFAALLSVDVIYEIVLSFCRKTETIRSFWKKLVR